MTELINNQLELIMSELEQVTDVQGRADLRIKLIGVLLNLGDNCSLEIETGKEAIKETKKKTTTKKKKEVVAEPVETEEVVEQQEVEEEQESEVVEGPVEIDLDTDPNLIDENATREPIIVSLEDEEGKGYEVNITDVYYTLDVEDEETKKEIASNIVSYNLTPVYETLSNLNDSNDKVMLSYYLQNFGLETINTFIEELTEGQFNDLYEFVNNDNVNGLVLQLEEAASEE